MKPKKCKGTGKAKGHGCGEMNVYRTYGLCNSCYRDWLLNTDEGRQKLNNITLKATKDRRELKKTEKQIKEERSISRELNLTKIKCHEYIRLRDKGKPCISCGIPYKSNFDAGHFYKAEIYSWLKFNELNIHGQCVQCNRRKEGNINAYAINLKKRIGEEKFNELEEKAAQGKKESFKWFIHELKELRKYYSRKIKELR